jgi:hypothetical protein
MEPVRVDQDPCSLDRNIGINHRVDASLTDKGG